MRAVLSGSNALETAEGDVREAQVERALDVEFVEFFLAARVEDGRARLAAQPDEFVFREAVRLAMFRGSAGDAQVRLDIDREIDDRRRLLGGG